MIIFLITVFACVLVCGSFTTFISLSVMRDEYESSGYWVINSRRITSIQEEDRSNEKPDGFYYALLVIAILGYPLNVFTGKCLELMGYNVDYI